jgi:hypothetical protein
LKKIVLILGITFLASSVLFFVTTIFTTGFSEGFHFAIVERAGGDEDFYHEFSETEEYSSIELRVTSARTIVRPSSDGITRIYYKSGGGLRHFEAGVRNNVLYIRERLLKAFVIDWSTTKNGELTIEIPQKDYDAILLNFTSGSLDISDIDISCRTLDIGMTSGRLNISGITSSEHTIRATSGDLEFDGAYGKGEVRISSGNVAVKYAEWNDSLNVRVTSGNVDIYLPEDSGLQMNSRVTSGKISYKLGENSGNVGAISGVKLGGENVQTVEVNMTSGNVRFHEAA